MEDDLDFDQYAKDMKKDGVWGGQMEMNILAQLYQFNVIVHQVDNPSMAQGFFPWEKVPCLHISFHLDCHFNSVRRDDDPCDGSPMMNYNIGHKLKKIGKAEKQDEGEEEKEEEGD